MLFHCLGRVEYLPDISFCLLGLTEVSRLEGQVSRLERDKLSLEATVSTLRKAYESIEEEERSLQEQLNIALGGGVSGS